MEIFGLMFAIPIAYFASLLYGKLLVMTMIRWPWMVRPFVFASSSVLVAIIAEWIALATLGALETRRTMGPSFHIVHGVNFLLGPPALTNILVLSKPVRERSPAADIALLATALAIVLILENIGVSEALYGLDGFGGPYGPARKLH